MSLDGIQNRSLHRLRQVGPEGDDLGEIGVRYLALPSSAFGSALATFVVGLRRIMT
jgi:hypothetical protein